VASLEQTTYELALRALAQQEHALTEIRSRTGTLLTASSLIASFLGAQAIARNGLNVWIVLALVAFGISVVLSIYVLLPKEGLIFALDAPETYERCTPHATTRPNSHAGLRTGSRGSANRTIPPFRG
jgi:hypothetical protein